MKNITRDNNHLLTTQEVADATNLAKQTILNYMRNGLITPQLTLPNGQCFFHEDVIVTLLVLSLSKEYKDNVLAVCLGYSEDCKEFKEAYDRYIKEHKITRIDDIGAYLLDRRDKIKSEMMCERLYVMEAIETTIRTCEKEVKKLSAEVYHYLLSRKDIEDMSVFWEHKGNLLDVDEIAPRLSKNDKRIYNASIEQYNQNVRRVEERYAYKDMQEQVKLLKVRAINEPMTYEPEKPAVRAIWRKVEQRHLRDCMQKYMEKRLKNGYVSVLCLDLQKDNWIYELISKGMNPCIRRIEIYCMTDITTEIQQLCDGLGEYKEVTFESELPERQSAW